MLILSGLNPSLQLLMMNGHFVKKKEGLDGRMGWKGGM
jgi:hypothetical protein